MKYLIPMALVLASVSAHAMECIQLGGSDDFKRVSATELVITDTYGGKYDVTVANCPELMMDEPIVVDPMGGQLCSSDVIRVGGDICPIENIKKL